MKENLSYYRISYWLFFLCFITGFLQRYYEPFNKITLVVFILVSISLLSTQKNNNDLLQLGKRYKYVYLILFFFAFYAIFNSTLPHFVVQLVITFSFLYPLIIINKLSYDENIKLIRFVMLISVLQILFDIFLPNPNYDELDLYAGTFDSGNNKARFLMFSLFILLAAFKDKKLFKDIYKTKNKKWVIFLYGIIIVSIYMGHSFMSILFFISAVLGGLLVKNAWKFIVANVVIYGGIFAYIAAILPSLSKWDGLWWFYYRFLDPNTGIYACYLYGWKLFQNSNYIGVGVGNFATRASILFKTPNAIGYPAVSISEVGIDNAIYNGINPPDWGMSSLYLYFIEGGLLMLPLFYIFFKKLWSAKAPNYIGIALYYYIFYTLNYWPHFFEDFVLYLYLAIVMLINNLIKYNKDNTLNVTLKMN